jgi:hypothetical protein
MLVLEITVVACFPLAVASIIWFSITTGIAPMPSLGRARRAIVEAAADAPAGPIAELGSGWGTLAIALARAYPARQVVGYEISWVPWLVSLLLKHSLRLQNLTLCRSDFLRADLAPFSLLSCYLFREGMHELAHKLSRNHCIPPVIISNTFALPWRRPDEVIRVEDLYRSRV